ncbi:MAG: aspartate aminotransferase family protein [Marinicaulis sp.]|nr:aspartate aminotransferase family protein [Marinicaulis sp.]
MNSSLQEKMFAELEETKALMRAADLARDHIRDAFDKRPFPTSENIDALAALSGPVPQSPSDPATIIMDMQRFAGDACVNAIGGRYFGFVTGGVLPIALAARWLSDAWDQNAPLFVTSPVAAVFEEVCEEWLRDMLRLPPETVAGFVSGSSMGIYCGLAAARYRLLQNKGWDINAKGLNGAPSLRVVAGRQAHATVIKAIALLGLGVDNIDWADVDDRGRMTPETMPSIDDATIVILQAGDVNSGAFDDFAGICPDAKGKGAWVHVDGAFGLWAAATERFAPLTAGMEDATSWSVDAHKTLNTPYDNGIVFTRDKEALNNALHAAGSYFVHGDRRDGMFYTPELSRRARAIELWAVLKYLGQTGVEELVGALHERSLQFASELREAGFEIANDVVFNQTLVACENDEKTQAVIKHIQDSGECWIGGAKYQGRDVIRISVCSWATTEADVSRSVQAFVAARDAD